MDIHSAEPSDEALMEQLRVHPKNEKALRQLIARHKNAVYALAYRMLGNNADAEEFTQLTFIRMWKAAGEYEPSCKFTTWLFTITKRLIFNEYRRKSRKPADSLSEMELNGYHPTTCPTTTPGAVLEQQELEQQVNAAILKLQPKARMAIQLRRYQELSYEEIADVLDTSVSATKSLIFRARQELKIMLQDLLSGGTISQKK